MSGFRLTLAGLLMLFVVPAGATYAQAATPTQIVEALHEALLAGMMNAEELGYAGRTKRVAEALPNAYDLDFMARKSVGRHWKQLSEDDQRQWINAFNRLMTANYAGRFDSYSDERFETIGEEAATHGTMIVRTKLVSSAIEDVQLDYRLQQADDGWRIIDVYLNGTVSQLALHRSDFSSVLKREGFAELISTIERMIAKAAEGEADQVAKPAP